MVGPLALHAHRKQARERRLGRERLERDVRFDARPLVVIQAGAAQSFVVQGETQRLDEVELRARVGGEPDDVSRVGGNFGLK